MTTLRKLLLAFESEISSFSMDGYELISRSEFTDEILCEMKHSRNSATLTILANLKFDYIKIYRNGKLSKTINF